MSQTFSRENVHFMKKFYQCFPIYIPQLNKLKWEHYLELLKIDDIKERYFYLKIAMFCSCSVLELKELISRNIYHTIEQNAL